MSIDIGFRYRLGMAVLPLLLMIAVPASAQIRSSRIGSSKYDPGDWYFQVSNRSQRSQYAVDTLRLDLRVLDTIAARVGARPVGISTDEACYERRVLGFPIHDYCFSAIWRRAETDTTLIVSQPWKTDTVRLRKDHAFGTYYFSASTQGNSRVSENLGRFLNSAYHQELFPSYKAMDSLFLPPLPQTRTGLWLRGGASLGWASQYTGRGNPFLASKNAQAWVFYLIDGFFAAEAAYVVARSLEEGDSGEIPLRLLGVKAIHTAFSYCFFMPFISIQFGETLKLQNSGFRFPRTMRTDPEFNFD